MTRELVEQLRKGTGDGLAAWDMMNEAADEIERLRAALKAIADYTPGKDTTALLLRNYARAALEPKP